jgi:4-diphosphocytidyl-2-C-methyl-D-erythritol kinase
MTRTDRVFVPAFAKINLTLDVLGKRADGYHELASVMQTVALADTIALRRREDEAIKLVCDQPELENEQNLAVRAANLLRSTQSAWGLTIELAKRIPTQAGLGGGSSDGAAVLVALNVLWRLGYDDEALTRLAAKLGSDVPFFIHGGTALIEGRGEVVTPLPEGEPLWVVLAKPDVGVSTAAVFGALRQEDWTNGDDTAAVVAAICAGQPLPFDRLSNALEPGVLGGSREVTEVRQRLLDAGAPVVRLSGSGPTLFAPFRTLQEATEVMRGVSHERVSLWLTRTITRGEAQRMLRGAVGEL